jgi:hypothetical protein
MNEGELIKLNELRNNGKILSKESESINYQNKHYVKTTIYYLFYDSSNNDETLLKSCKIGFNKKKSVIKCYNDLINKKDLLRLYYWGLLIDNDESPSYPNTSSEE